MDLKVVKVFKNLHTAFFCYYDSHPQEKILVQQVGALNITAGVTSLEAIQGSLFSSEALTVYIVRRDMLNISHRQLDTLTEH